MISPLDHGTWKCISNWNLWQNKHYIPNQCTVTENKQKKKKKGANLRIAQTIKHSKKKKRGTKTLASSKSKPKPFSITEMKKKKTRKVVEIAKCRKTHEGFWRAIFQKTAYDHPQSRQRHRKASFSKNPIDPKTLEIDHEEQKPKEEGWENDEGVSTPDSDSIPATADSRPNCHGRTPSLLASSSILRSSSSPAPDFPPPSSSNPLP